MAVINNFVGRSLNSGIEEHTTNTLALGARFTCCFHADSAHRFTFISAVRASRCGLFCFGSHIRFVKNRFFIIPCAKRCRIRQAGPTILHSMRFTAGSGSLELCGPIHLNKRENVLLKYNRAAYIRRVWQQPCYCGDNGRRHTWLTIKANQYHVVRGFKFVQMGHSIYQ